MCDLQVRQSEITSKRNASYKLPNQAWSTVIHGSQEPTLYQIKFQLASHDVTHIDHAYHVSVMNF